MIFEVENSLCSEDNHDDYNSYDWGNGGGYDDGWGFGGGYDDGWGYCDGSGDGDENGNGE
jgi:hypothetical protein